ncbi:hypothetical protein CJ739_3159 [Mariniflexile rhizosphaerae]|uniref:three component ABC system middle component n=1 Tax=unclassified Mariniflexile TaxID=2643887 RepID=UPI000CB26A1D|nr:three component ABC system middle component [Mariniflexile sp. TRM1-10]AXP82221.1 hypothetical protein CJ739_3159 [Mariniflexile sp. TRM1-10]PLB19214.1 MAG: hypothetical protein TRG1_1918 [Flavobacteriaceae bacterium FS1-H7996/R]
MRAKDINILLYNPIWTSKILHHFISGACESKLGKLKFELIYMGLPFIFDEVIFEKLINSNKNSSISTLFKSIELKNQLILMPNKIEEFKKITNQGLIYLGNKHKLVISDFIQMDDKIQYNKEQDMMKKQYFKAAYNWGQIIAKEDCKNIFIKLEIVNI